MSKSRKAYDNVYTQQMEELVVDQRGYDAKKAVEKEKIREANRLQRKNVQGIFVLIGLVLLGGIGYFINLDPDNSGPLAVLFAIALTVGGGVWVFRR